MAPKTCATLYRCVTGLCDKTTASFSKVRRAVSIIQKKYGQRFDHNNTNQK